VGRAVKALWAVAAPPCLVAIVFAASGVAALVTGRPLVWPARSVTLSEAMANRDQGEVVRQVTAGVSLDARYDVYDVIKPGRHTPATPLEASIATREQYMFDLGLAYGARLGPDNARVLFCLAEAERATDIRDELQEKFGPQNCDGVPLPW
jgi:hypothetical protein